MVVGAEGDIPSVGPENKIPVGDPDDVVVWGAKPELLQGMTGSGKSAGCGLEELLQGAMLAGGAKQHRGGGSRPEQEQSRS